MTNGKETARNRGKFVPGTAPGPGRAKGSKNRSTLVGRELMQALEAGDEDGLLSALERWKRLLNDADAGVRLAAERFVFQSLYGQARAAVTVEADGTALLLASAEWRAICDRFVELVNVRPELRDVLHWAVSGEGPRPLPVLDVRPT